MSAIDLEQRPAGYFAPLDIEQHLVAGVRGSLVRAQMQALLDAGRRTELRQLLDVHGIPETVRLHLEASHPMFMGGNYLPERAPGEVEIARITIRSTTYDVTAVYARAQDGRIHYRVVDEYDGATLEGRDEACTEEPMTLGALARFFLGAWPLLQVLEANCGGDQAASLGFFDAASAFYPDFDALCRQEVVERFPLPEEAGDTY